ncbi:hypothetical protein HDV06_005049 [Boothiomyces sp. JEL0866]|nr:hypothetical protein HDV06_005049 [Boothiomyces sp. JEL0866]
MIANNEPALPKDRNKPINILVAKALSPDSGEFLPNQKKKVSEKVMDYNILGDVEDFQEFNKLYNGHVSESEVEEEHEPLEEEPAIQIDPEIKEREDKELNERKEWLNKLHIFQRYREIREEHALKNWERHCNDWSKMEEHISKISGKKPEDLLMTRLCEYRQVVEEKRLIEEALRVLEDQKIDFWKEGIKIGNDLLGLSFQLPSGGPRQVDKKGSPVTYQDIRKKDLGQIMKHTGTYIEAVGQSINKLEYDLAKAFLERLEKAASEKNVTLPAEEIANAEEEAENNLKPGMHLEISSTRLFFEVELNRISTSILTVHNRGTCAVHFEWAPVRRDNPLNTKHSHSGNQTFFFSYIKGVILPGTAFDFPIVFKSCRNGIFTDIWKLVTLPYSPDSSEIRVTLKGVAYEKDMLVKKRGDIEKLLQKRCAETVGKEAIKLVMQRVQSAQMRAHRPYKNNLALRFEEINRPLNLKYNLEIYHRLQELKDKVFKTLGAKLDWTGSVTQLYEYAVNVENDEERTQFICDLNDLVRKSCHDDSSVRSELRFVICNEIIMSLASKLVDVSDELRKQMGLPLTRQSNVFFNPEDPQEDFENFELSKATVDVQKKPGGPPGKVAAVPVAAAGKDPKKGAAPVPAKVDPKKPGQKKPNEEPEEAIPTPKVAKKKPTSSKGWSAERRLQEQSVSLVGVGLAVCLVGVRLTVSLTCYLLTIVLAVGVAIALVGVGLAVCLVGVGLTVSLTCYLLTIVLAVGVAIALVGVGLTVSLTCYLLTIVLAVGIAIALVGVGLAVCLTCYLLTIVLAVGVAIAVV